MRSETSMWRILGHLAVFMCLAFVPSVVFAAPPRNFKEVAGLALSYVRLLIPLVIGLTLLLLIWGIVRAWIFGAGNTEKIEQGQQIALWGVIGLVVAIGVWGIVALVRTSLFGNL